ncbi:hypothetical protein GCM10022225_59120 [Plantactinospora mayteni]|uniref:Transposase n=1 Tax=Plantactinospora mayteni TaxID=566021 RepID=A0ABQ4EM24_9ACTN|nr:hypothetical protein [Plantactinospora mayteni]GIG95237.1 hypothetical protein Pma05_18100 [Plantactinospora mayteni]
MIGRRAASSALAALLDRSVAQIGAASDARRFDRSAIYRVADVWDNNTFALFRAAVTRPSWCRERRSRAALAWMADLGPTRRQWMTEQAEAAGCTLAGLLPPPMEEPAHHRDHRGVVMPADTPLTAGVAVDLEQDYHLAGGELRALRVERAGHRHDGLLTIAVPRRYPVPGEPDEPALLRLTLTDVSTADVDSADTSGVRLHAGPDGGSVRVGTHGVVRATGIDVGYEDPSWHLSAVGRAADARTPRRQDRPRRPRPVESPPLTEAGAVAAHVVHRAMLMIRMVGHQHLVDTVPLRALCLAFADAGAKVFRAGATVPRRREQAFRTLVEEWVQHDALPAGWPGRLLELPRRGIRDGQTAEWLRALVSDADVRPRTDQPPAGLRSTAELALVSYTARHDRYGVQRDASAVVQLALPPDNPDDTWRLRGLRIDAVRRFRLTGAALDGTHTVQVGDGGDSVETVDGALAVTGGPAAV